MWWGMMTLNNSSNLVRLWLREPDVSHSVAWICCTPVICHLRSALLIRILSSEIFNPRFNPQTALWICEDQPHFGTQIVVRTGTCIHTHTRARTQKSRAKQVQMPPKGRLYWSLRDVILSIIVMERHIFSSRRAGLVLSTGGAPELCVSELSFSPQQEEPDMSHPICPWDSRTVRTSSSFI